MGLLDEAYTPPADHPKWDVPYFGATYEDVVAETAVTPDITALGDLGLEGITAEDIMALVEYMNPREKREFEAILRNSPPTSLLPHQMVPHHKDWWDTYLLLGGRGVGKTVAGASEIRMHLRALGPRAMVGIGAPTVSDVRDICMEGPTGLITMFPNEFVDYRRSMGEATHIFGGKVKAMGTEDPSRWNGRQWTEVWFDELSLCNQDSWNMAMMGLRLGEHPRAIATCTPKNKKWIRALSQKPTTFVPQYIDEETGILRLPRTKDNQFLPKRRVDFLYNAFGGSRLGRQELEADFLDDIEGAMWKRDDILHSLDPSTWPRFQRIVVAVDPAGSAARKMSDKNAQTEEDRLNQRKNCDTGIAVVALGVDGYFYVLEMKAGQWTPKEWAIEAIKLFVKFRADKLVAEKNFGGLMVEGTIKSVDAEVDIRDDKGFTRRVRLNGRHLPVTLVTASRGKDIRAQPVATLYEQHKVFHCKDFGLGEDQMCAFINAEDNEGADMVDALVWGFIELAGLDMTGNQYVVLPGHQKWKSFIVR